MTTKNGNGKQHHRHYNNEIMHNVAQICNERTNKQTTITTAAVVAIATEYYMCCCSGSQQHVTVFLHI